jgi:hypothetical protein
MYFDICTMYLVQFITRVYKVHRTYIKIIGAQEARMCNIYNNTKLKLRKTNTAIWYNTMCTAHQLTHIYHQNG